MHTITLQPLPLSSPRGHKFSTCRVRSAFTLVELLVVIVILAMLASLVTVAASRAMTAARNAAIKAEIDMLHMAIMNYKNEHGSFPPRCINPNVQFTAVGLSGEQTWPALGPANALVVWLSGFTTDPTTPLRPDSDRKRLYDFDRSRITTALSYHPSGKPQSPYIFIKNGASATGGYGTIATSGPSAGVTNATYGAYKPLVRITASDVSFFNPDSFQILCAGRDEIWDEDTNLNGVLEPAEDVNGNGVWDKSDDDLSNFWPGTRKDYLDSLNQ
jgi:prepilin-type N-terminal cleavage/methylation domain-containing protein